MDQEKLKQAKISFLVETLQEVENMQDYDDILASLCPGDWAESTDYTDWDDDINDDDDDDGSASIYDELNDYFYSLDRQFEGTVELHTKVIRDLVRSAFAKELERVSKE